MSQIQSFSRLSAILTMDNTQFLRGTEVASKRLAAFSAKATTLGANITRSLGVGLALVGTAAILGASYRNFQLRSERECCGGGHSHNHV